MGCRTQTENLICVNGWRLFPCSRTHPLGGWNVLPLYSVHPDEGQVGSQLTYTTSCPGITLSLANQGRGSQECLQGPISETGLETMRKQAPMLRLRSCRTVVANRQSDARYVSNRNRIRVADRHYVYW